jgi:hypothetical protein
VWPQNVFEKPACGPQTSAIPQVPAALGGPLRASQTHSQGAGAVNPSSIATAELLHRFRISATSWYSGEW